MNEKRMYEVWPDGSLRYRKTVFKAARPKRWRVALQRAARGFSPGRSSQAAKLVQAAKAVLGKEFK